MTNVVLCDDNNEFLEYLKDIVIKTAEKNDVLINIKTYTSGESLLFDMEESINEIDILFIDVLMNELNGVETVSRLRKLESDAKVIFLTSAKSHVFEALDFMPLHYLIKEDVTSEKVEEVFMKAVSLSQSDKENIFVFKIGHDKRYVKYEDILYFEINNRLVYIHCKNNIVEEFYSTMDKIEEDLNSKEFVRIHRSFMVNLRMVQSIDSKNVTLRNGTELSVGRTYLASLREAYADFLFKNI